MKYHDIKTILCVLMFIMLTGCSIGDNQMAILSKSHDFQSGGTIEINAKTAIVKVVGWDKSEVKVTAKGYGDPELLPSDVEVEKAIAFDSRPNNGHLTITLNNAIIDSDENSEGLLDAIFTIVGIVKNTAVYEIHIPKDSRCNVSVQKGAIEFDDVEGRVDATLDVGEIKAGISGNEENVLQVRGKNCTLAAQYTAGRWVQF